MPNSGRSRRFLSHVTLNWTDDLKKTIGPLFYAISKLCASFHNHQWNQTGVTGNKQNQWFFVLCDLQIWQRTLYNNRPPPLCYFKLCAPFRNHQRIQTGVTARKCPIWFKIGDFLLRVTLRFHEWSWKTIGRLSVATSSFVHHFITVCEFEVELQSGNG